MKSSKTTTKLFATVMTVIIAVGIWFALGARRAQAIQDSEDFPSPFGISFGQTARLSVLNSGERGIIIDWRFLDGQGHTLARAAGPQTIPPNQMRSFDLNADDLGAVRDRFGRIQVLAVVRALGGPDTKNLHTSLEVFDNATGKTTIFIPSPLIKGFNPQPDPPGIRQ